MGDKKSLKEKIAIINSRTSFTPEEKALKIKMLDFEDLLDRFESDKEAKKRAKDKLERYLQDYDLESEADKSTLKNLIYLEVMNSRLQDKADEIYRDSKAVNVQSLETIQGNIEKIQKLKDTLGLSKKDDGQDNPAKIFYSLQAKVKKWLSENPLGRDFTCPACGKIARLVIRMDKYDAIKHPFVGKDRVLLNPWLTKLFSEGKITKLDYANILGVSEDYITWLMQKFGDQILKEVNNKSEVVQ